MSIPTQLHLIISLSISYHSQKSAPSFVFLSLKKKRKLQQHQKYSNSRFRHCRSFVSLWSKIGISMRWLEAAPPLPLPPQLPLLLHHHLLCLLLLLLALVVTFSLKLLLLLSLIVKNNKEAKLCPFLLHHTPLD